MLCMLWVVSQNDDAVNDDTLKIAMIMPIDKDAVDDTVLVSSYSFSSC